jgi:hypothetical protein
MPGPLFWGYANLAFDFLLIFIFPLAVAVRELVLLRRYDRGGRRDAPD